MSSGGSGNPALRILAALPGILLTLVSFYLLGVISYSIYLYVNKDDQSVLPPTEWWWPQWLNTYLHNYPRQYDVLSNTYMDGQVSNVYSNVYDNETCISKCEDESPDCIAAMSNTASNVCMTMTDTSFPIQFMGNTVSIVQGMEPSESYATYKSNIADTYTPHSNIAQYISTSYLECASNCSSNVTCLGFEYQWATNTCIQHTAIRTSNLAYDTSFTSYILRSGIGDFSTF
jgi:hypothetical protein